MKRGVLIRYRVMAYVTGVMLLALCASMVNRYLLDGSDQLSLVVAQVHGFAYVLYVIFTFEVGMKLRWKPVRFILMLLAGTIPVCSFVAERKVVHEAAPRVTDARQDTAKESAGV